MTKSNASPFQLAVGIVVGYILLTLGFYYSGSVSSVAFLSNYMIPLVAIIVFGLAFNIWRRVKNFPQSEKTFRFFAIGFLLWALGEVTWVVLVKLGLEPYPSIADLFWFVGYVPLIFGLYLSIRAFDVKLSTQTILSISSIVLFFLLLVIFLILVPVIQYYEPGTFTANLFNILYPLTDIVLLSQALILFFVSRESRFEKAWLIIVVGFSLTVIGDLGFSIADWNGFYDYENWNLFSRMIDWVYTTSNPVLLLGLLAYWLEFRFLTKAHIDMGKKEVLEDIPFSNMTVIVNTNDDNLIVNVSDNFLSLTSYKEKEACKNRSLSAILGNNDDKINDIIKKINEDGKIAGVPVQLKTSDDKKYSGWLSALAIRDAGYGGAVMAIQVYAQDAASPDELSDYHKKIAQNIFDQNSMVVIDHLSAYSSYFSGKAQILMSLIMEFQGNLATKTVVAKLNSLSVEQNWGVKFSNHDISIDPHYKLPEMKECFPPLLAALESETIALTDKVIVENEILKFRAEINPIMLKAAQEYGLD